LDKIIPLENKCVKEFLKFYWKREEKLCPSGENKKISFELRAYEGLFYFRGRNPLLITIAL
jgi:hypothetical protein